MKKYFSNTLISMAVVMVFLFGIRDLPAQEPPEADKPGAAVPEVTEIGSGIDKFLSVLRRSSRARARASSVPCGVSHPMFQFYGPELSFLAEIDPKTAGKMLLLQGELMIAMGETLIEQGQTMQENGYR